VPCLAVIAAIFVAMIFVSSVQGSSARAAARRHAEAVAAAADPLLSEAVRSYTATLVARYPLIEWEPPELETLRDILGLSALAARTATTAQEEKLARTSPTDLLSQAVWRVQTAFVAAFLNPSVGKQSDGSALGYCARCGLAVASPGQLRDGLCTDCFAIQPQNRGWKGLTTHMVSSTGMVHAPGCSSATRATPRKSLLGSLREAGHPMCRRCHPHLLQDRAIKEWQPSASSWCEAEKYRQVAASTAAIPASPPPNRAQSVQKKSDVSWGWVAVVAVIILVGGAALWSAMSPSSSPTVPTAGTTGGTAGAGAQYIDNNPDGHTHTNEKGHVHTQVEWVDGYTRSDGTYVKGHYRAVE